MRVVATPGYDRRARKLLTPSERTTTELEIVVAPTAWPVIAGTGGARKARAARGGRGKSGGARIIYYVVRAFPGEVGTGSPSGNATK